MVDDDIYGNKRYYERFLDRLSFLHLPPEQLPDRFKVRRAPKYYCRNPDNVEHFHRLISHLESRDLSYIHRLRVLHDLLFISFYTEKNLIALERDDINMVVSAMHRHYKSPSSKSHFVKHLKHIWKTLFPETDHLGRVDDTATPYVVRHISSTPDKSRNKLRKDKMTVEEYRRILEYFSNDLRIQAYLALAYESLGRPQEILYVRIENVELRDNYAKVWIADHGKEGPGLLQCIDSYPYLLRWLSLHPERSNPEAFLFINLGRRNAMKQLTPNNINKKLRLACKNLGINKPITCYSFKRNGVTIRRLRGESDVEIQHAARWASTKQLKTYDLSVQSEALDIQLQKRGIIAASEGTKNPLDVKKCGFCNTVAGSTDIVCPQCQRPLDKKLRMEEMNKDAELKLLRHSLAEFRKELALIKQGALASCHEKVPLTEIPVFVEG